MLALTVVEIMDSIVVTSLMIRIVLRRTRLSLKKKGTMLQEVVAMVEDVLMVVSIIRAKAIMNGTSLELPTSAYHNGIQCFDRVWMDFYGKCQAWSGTPNAHNTGFHDVALLAESSYYLCSTHLFS